MTQSTAQASLESSRIPASSRRLGGVDAARGLALVGMMAAHLLPESGAGGGISPWHQLVAGRAAALFAVLAGVGLALSNGRTQPPGGVVLWGARASTAGRALVLLFVGLLLGHLDSGLAVILAYYGLLFLVAIPLLGLSARTLAIAAAVAAVLTPAVGHVLRPHLPRPSPDNLELADLEHPWTAVTTLFATGYYPVLMWSTYLLAGLALGRLALASTRVAAALLGLGASLAVLAWSASWLLMHPGGGFEQMQLHPSPTAWFDQQHLWRSLTQGLYGTTPSTSWWWLSTVAPHSGTPFDLVQTTGFAIAVIGACLLVVGHGGVVVRVLLTPLMAAGSMTLTLYSLHVIGVARGWGPDDPAEQFWANVVVALLAATLWRSGGWRGPLEAVTAALSRAARRGTERGLRARSAPRR